MARTAIVLLLLFVTACGSAGSTGAPVTKTATPTADTVLARYRATIDADMRSVTTVYIRNGCSTRARCAGYLAQLVSTTTALMDDATSLPAPTANAGQVAAITEAARQFIAQVDSAAVEVQRPNSNYQAAAAMPNIHPLDLAVAELLCWPSQPVDVGPGNDDFSCG